MSDETGGRTQEHEIRIRAAIDEVWKALTDGEELTRWFVEAAEVEPREGGTFEVDFGGGDAAQQVIEVWEPGRRLRLAARPDEGVGFAYVEEFVLEADGEETVVRLVTSGIPEGPDWDGFYDGTFHGWGLFLRTLRHYLERHTGLPRDHFAVSRRVPLEVPQAWDRLVGAGGLAAREPLPAAGRPYRLTTAGGDTLAGTVLHREPPHSLSLTVDDLGDALLSAAFHRTGEAQSYLFVTLSTYGLGAERLEEARRRMLGWVAAVAGSDGLDITPRERDR